jgi:hypothetical protein
MDIFRILENNKAIKLDLAEDQEDEFLKLNKSSKLKFIQVDQYPESEFDDVYIYDPESNTIRIDEQLELQKLKDKFIDELKQDVTSYIYEYYPPEKQKADDKQKDYYGTALMILKQKKKQPLTTTEIYLQVATYVNQILAGEAKLSEILETLPQDERFYWEQLIKAGCREAWTVRCTQVFSQMKQRIKQAMSKEQLFELLNKDPGFPPFPQFE